MAHSAYKNGVPESWSLANINDAQVLTLEHRQCDTNIIVLCHEIVLASFMMGGNNELVRSRSCPAPRFSRRPILKRSLRLLFRLKPFAVEETFATGTDFENR